MKELVSTKRFSRRTMSELTLSRQLVFVAALMSLLMSVYLFFSGSREQGIFVGLWVPSILSAAALIHTGGRHG